MSPEWKGPDDGVVEECWSVIKEEIEAFDNCSIIVLGFGAALVNIQFTDLLNYARNVLNIPQQQLRQFVDVVMTMKDETNRISSEESNKGKK